MRRVGLRRVRQLPRAIIKRLFQRLLLIPICELVPALLGHRCVGKLLAKLGNRGIRRILFRQLALKSREQMHRILRRRSRPAAKSHVQFARCNKGLGANLLRRLLEAACGIGRSVRGIRQG